MSVKREAAPTFICDLLEARPSLDRADVSARWVAKQLGQTTGFLYHHWGSFDAFLVEVSGVAWGRLVDALMRAWKRKPALASVIEAYVDFALDNPVLYWLIAERPLSAEIIAERLGSGRPLPSYEGVQALVQLLSRVIPGFTMTRGRALHAAVHGLASQMLSNRLGSTPDTYGRAERRIAGDVAREIASLFTEPRSSRSPARDRRAGSPPRPRKRSRPPSSSR